MQTCLDDVHAYDAALREEEHAEQDAHREDHGDDDRKAVEVALHDARGGVRVVQAARDHVRDARTLAGMHEDESDERKRRERPYDEDEDLEYITDPELIDEKFGDIVDLVIDGGIGGIEPSTVVKCTEDEPEIVRQGKGWLEES